VGLEAYDNYDMWRSEIYGGASFTSGQLQWLAENLAAASGSISRVLFYHYDFLHQINLSALGAEMALWGHIHRDQGSISTRPYDLATNNLCDGERSYRLVRVSGGELMPSPTVSAGAGGGSLEVDFEPANDGAHYEVSAHVTNNIAERFEHAVLRFMMPEACDSMELTGGTLSRIEQVDSVAVYHVSVDILPQTSQVVSLALDTTGIHQDTTEVAHLSLTQTGPNPFSSETALRLELPQAGRVRLAVYDVTGREVAVLLDEHLPAGPQILEWDGHDSNRRRASSGIYLAQLSYAGRTKTLKIVLAR